MKRKQFSFSDYAPRKRIVGAVAGAVNGFIAGNVPGAVMGAGFGYQTGKIQELEDDLSSKKTMGRSLVNKQAGRASMSKSGSKALKSIKGKKKVRVGKVLKKKIKAVMAGKGVYGKFVKCWGGHLGVCHSNTAWPTIATVGPYTSVKPVMYPKYTSGSTTNNFTHWAFLLNANNPTLNTSFVTGKELGFFTAAKVLDAASVLWNKKTPALDGQFTSTDNFSTRVDPGGAGTPDQSYISQAKIHVINSFVQFVMKNNSKRDMYIEIKTLVPKLAIATALPLDNYESALSQDCLANGRVIQEDLNTYSTKTSAILDWHDIPSFTSNWKWETTRINIKAGETCSHSIQGPRNTVYDYAKMVFNGLNGTTYLTKKAVYCIMSVLPSLESASVYDTGITWVPGHFYPPDSLDVLLDPIAVEVKEVYKLHMPENAGFIQQAIVANQNQELNLRTERRAFLNYFTGDPSETLLTYTIVPEEQPGTSVTDAQIA